MSLSKNWKYDEFWELWALKLRNGYEFIVFETAQYDMVFSTKKTYNWELTRNCAPIATSHEPLVSPYNARRSAENFINSLQGIMR